MRAWVFVGAAALALSACSTSRETSVTAAATGQAVAVAEGPPIVDGVYAYPDCEGEGGCPNTYWRTVQSTPLRAEQSQSAGEVATLLPGEWVRVEQLETRVLAQRGVVRDDTPPDFQAGEVVYKLAHL